MFISSGAGAKVLVSLYFMIMACDTVEFLIMKLIWYALSAWQSPLYSGRHVMGIVNNYTSFFPFSEGQPMKATSFHTFHPPTRLFTAALENFEDFECLLSTSLPLLLGTSMLLHVV